MKKYILAAGLILLGAVKSFAACTPLGTGLQLDIPNFNDPGIVWASCMRNNFILLNDASLSTATAQSIHDEIAVATTTLSISTEALRVQLLQVAVDTTAIQVALDNKLEDTTDTFTGILTGASFRLVTTSCQGTSPCIDLGGYSGTRTDGNGLGVGGNSEFANKLRVGGDLQINHNVLSPANYLSAPNAAFGTQTYSQTGAGAGVIRVENNVESGGFTENGGIILSNDISGNANTASGAPPTGTAGGLLSGTYPNPGLADTAVTLGSYGSATQSPTFTVDQDGRLTAAANVTISGVAPSGTAGGSLSGTYPNPGIAVGAVGDSEIAATAVTLGSYGSATQSPTFTVDADGRLTAANNVTIAGVTPAGTAGGSLSGTYPNPGIAVGAVGTSELAATAVTLGNYGSATQSPTYTVDADGRLTAAANVTIAGVAPGGSAGGDLAGTYPNPTIAANAVALGVDTTGDYVESLTGNTQIGVGTATGEGSTPALSINANSVGTAQIGTGGVDSDEIAANAVGASELAATAVTLGSYGSATQSPTFTVDADGRLTAAANVTISGVAPSGTAGGSLSGTYPNPGIATNAVGASELAATAVTLGSYGSATQSPTYTVDADGRLTSAANVTISGVAPGGSAGGSLSGTYPNPGLATDSVGATQIAANAVGASELAATAVTLGSYGSATQSPTFTVDADGRLTAAANTTIAGVAPGGSAGGSLSGTYPNPGIATNAVGASEIAATAVTLGSYGSATQSPTYTVDADGRLTAAANVTIAGVAPGGSAGGSLSGTYPNPGIATDAVGASQISVGAVGASELAATAVTLGAYGSATQSPTFTVDADGRLTAAANTTISGVAPGGSAGGDLSGTYPNPGLAANSVGTSEIVTNGVDADEIAANAVGTSELAATAVTLGSYGSATQSPTYTVDADGRLTAAANVTIAGVAPGGSAGGSLSGTYPNPGLATDSVGATQIAANAVGASELAATAVTLGAYGSATQSPTYTVDADGRLTAAANVTIAGVAPGGTAGGSLSGTYPNPGLATDSVGAGQISVGAVGSSELAATAVTLGSYGSATQSPTYTVDADGRLTAAANVTISGVAPGGTAGGKLSGTYPNPTLATGGVGASELAATAVTLGAYGSATQSPTYTVDADGRLTAAANVTIVPSNTPVVGVAGPCSNGEIVEKSGGVWACITTPTGGGGGGGHEISTATASDAGAFTLPTRSTMTFDSSYFNVTDGGAVDDTTFISLVETNNLQLDHYRVEHSTGRGSTGVRCKTFVNTIFAQGPSITYTNDFVNGDKWTINEDGVYSISYLGDGAANDHFAISRGDADCTTTSDTLDETEVLAAQRDANSGFYPVSLAWTGFLPAGEILKAHQRQAPGEGNGDSAFNIIKMDKPSIGAAISVPASSYTVIGITADLPTLAVGMQACVAGSTVTLTNAGTTVDVSFSGMGSATGATDINTGFLIDGTYPEDTNKDRGYGSSTVGSNTHGETVGFNKVLTVTPGEHEYCLLAAGNNTAELGSNAGGTGKAYGQFGVRELRNVAGSGDVTTNANNTLTGDNTYTGDNSFTNGTIVGDPVNTSLPKKYVYAKSIDGATQSAGCIVVLRLSDFGASPHMVFTSTTTSNQVLPVMLAEDCDPGEICKVQTYGPARPMITGTSAVGNDFGTATTRCYANPILGPSQSGGGMFIEAGTIQRWVFIGVR